MKNKINYNSKFFKYSIAIILILFIILLLDQIEYILVPLQRIFALMLFPIVGAGFLYYMLRPLVRYLENKKINRSVTVIGIFLSTIGFIVILSIYGSEFLRNEFNQLRTNFWQQFEVIQNFIENTLLEDNGGIISVEDIETRAVSMLELAFGSFGQNITGWISSIVHIGTILILIPIVTFFLLKDEHKLYESVIQLIPQKHKETTIDLLEDIDDTLSAYIIGQLIVALFLGTLTFIGYLLIGLPNALILALFSMIVSVIPLLGPILGVFPAVLIGLTVDYFMVLKVLIVLAIAEQLESSVVRPSIMGKRLHIHPLIVIFLLLIAVSLYGIIGAFIVVPVYAVARVLFQHFYKLHQSEAKQKPME